MMIHKSKYPQLSTNLQAVPALTLYKGKEGLPKPSFREKLEALPWWIALHHLGQSK